MDSRMVWWTFGILVGLVDLGRSDEMDLYEHLADDLSETHTHVRPKVKHNEPVEVHIGFELLKIISVEEKKQVMTSIGFFIAEWSADHIRWSPSTFGDLYELVLPPSTVWLPDFGLANSAGSFYQSSFTKDFRVRIRHTGNITWAFGGELSTLCKLDMTYYPFDLQKCEICLENLAYDGEEVVLKARRPNIAMSEYEQNGVWHIADSLAEDKLVYFNSTNKKVSEVRFILFMQRKALFYILNLICPCALICVVALAVYWLPADSGEKVSLGVTVLLAFSVFQLVIADQTPVNSDYTPILSRMVLSIMSLSSVSVLTSIWILYIHHKDSSHKVPPCLKAVFFRGLAPVLCMSSIVPPKRPGIDPKVAPCTNVVVENECGIDGGTDELLDTQERILKYENKIEASAMHPSVAKILENLVYMTDRIKTRDEEQVVVAEWRALAKVLDRMLFWVSTVVILVVFVTLVTQQDTEH